MLKGIPAIIPPELLKVLAEMGHGDELCIGDGNFPGETMGKRVVRMDGHGVPEILDAVLKLIPLDTFVDQPVTLMQVVPGNNPDVPIWDQYRAIVKRHDPRGVDAIEFVERFAYYERARQCYCVVMTGEKAVYANVIVKKGVVVGKDAV